MWPGHLSPVGRFSDHPGREPAEPAATPAFEGLEPIEPRMLLSADVSPWGMHTLGVSPDVSTIKIAARRSASETNPTSRGMGQFTITRSGGSRSEPLTVNYSIGGTATPGDDYNGLSGSVVIPAGKSSVTLDVLPVDDAIAEDVEMVVVTLAEDAGYNLGSTSTQSATVRIADNEPTVKITARRSASETNPASRGMGQFTVTRTGGSKDSPLDVYYTIDGTASHGQDYQMLDGWVTIPAGKTSVTIDIIPIDDVQVEDVETVVLTLEDHEAYRLGPTSTQSATLRIADNEPVVKIVASKAAASETDPTNRGMGRFTVTRTGGSTDAPLILFLAYHGSASLGTDCAPLSGVVIIPAGQRSTAIEVIPIDDSQVEAVETVTLTIIGTDMYRLGPGSTRSATVRIADNEPTVRITATKQASEADPAAKGMGRFTVSRSGGSIASDLTVYYTVEGTAMAGDDYQPLTDSVVIPAGKNSVVLEVTPIADTELEPTETVVVSLITDASYRLGAAATTSATVRIANVLAVDYARAMGMGYSEGTWRYDSWLRGIPGDYTRSVISASNGNYVYRRTFQSYDDSISGNDLSRWHVDEQAVSYVYTSQDISELLGLPEGDMQTVQLPLSPRVLSGSFRSSVPLTISFDGIGTLSGSVSVTTQLVGSRTITVPLGQFEAYKVQLRTKFSLKGTIIPPGDVRERATTFTLTMDEKIWFVPDVGVVHVNETDSARLFLAGYGTHSATLTSSSSLAYYDV
ncbi:MAG: LEPR-XLL domain-containing protein [Phycisphaeraceae bacterium]|nr:LEPR-XLL domain-containing protein [Phycisphaeraceae bacterium]